MKQSLKQYLQERTVHPILVPPLIMILLGVIGLSIGVVGSTFFPLISWLYIVAYAGLGFGLTGAISCLILVLILGEKHFLVEMRKEDKQ